ncbi:MAG: cysteine--tRNA ligase [Candidatus Atribacteria bacterium]|nr:cysteine--tRNA ligase [Candidatus Atribacteria bacterium]
MYLYNTLTQKKELFVPQNNGKIGFYACGPTVYDLIHIGNARVFVIFDCLRRFFEQVGYEVTYVQNFTDVDDKIINRAREKGLQPEKIASFYIEQYLIDAERLGITQPTVSPRATEHIQDIIALIQRLEARGYTYTLEGDILFDVSRFSDYGKLSRKPLEDQIEGARVEARYQKRNPADFVLWKSAKPGEPYWESPWGKGRPGWHIECSAMSMKYLGETIDIHAGGIDLIFPHHENEIAQSEAATGKTFVKYWLHNGYVNIQNEKMSKSLGNILTVRELYANRDPRVLRLVILFTHYRNPINIDDTILDAAGSYLNRIKNFVRNFFFIFNQIQSDSKWQENDESLIVKIQVMYEKFIASLADDFNTPQALAVLSDFIKEMNSYLQPKRRKWNLNTLESILSFLHQVNQILGIIPLQGMEEEDREVLKLIQEREKARKNRDFSQADFLRDTIVKSGYIIEDTPLGPRYYRDEG